MTRSRATSRPATPLDQDNCAGSSTALISVRPMTVMRGSALHLGSGQSNTSHCVSK